eukprot:GHRQ01022411.1.p1 GENE.GHRQ01022411.1~~GHRQ01022411.1.p1  ORF type:complete len:200 (+),score=95.50 GHRQ01022411.1:1340-1939(+)
MKAYQAMWRKIDTASAAVSISKQQGRAAAGSSETDTYFAQSWQRRNLNLQAALVAAAAPPAAGTCNVMVTKVAESGGGSSKTSSGGLLGAISHSLMHSKQQQQKKRTQQDEEARPKHAFSNYLIMMLQSMSMLPSLLLLAYMVLQQISRQTWSRCPLRPHDNEWLPILNNLGMRVLWQLILSTAAAPIWTCLAFKKTPK